MNEYYRQGFIDKCAELGIDPDALCKRAMTTGKILKMVGSGLNKGGDRAQASDILRNLAKKKRIMLGSDKPLTEMTNKELLKYREHLKPRDPGKPEYLKSKHEKSKERIAKGDRYEQTNNSDPNYRSNPSTMRTKPMTDYFDKGFSRIYRAND